MQVHRSFFLSYASEMHGYGFGVGGCDECDLFLAVLVFSCHFDKHFFNWHILQTSDEARTTIGSATWNVQFL